MGLLFKKIAIAGSLIGGMKETQDCINFCHKHKILPNIKLVKWNELDEVYESLQKKNDSVIRYKSHYIYIAVEVYLHYIQSKECSGY